MAHQNPKNALTDFPLAHVPTLALAIGTLVFWVELYVIRLPEGRTSWLGWVLLALCGAGLVLARRQRPLPLKKEGPAIKMVFAVPVLLAVIYLLIGLYASLLPPHLAQETDALTYHLTIPRQHLLRHSFAPLPWSVPDLFLLPLDYALGPFELCTPWPNKLIQFVFFLGCLGCVYHLVYIFSGGSAGRSALGVVAVMATHAVAIQVGLAMLDLVMLYCFLAGVHSILAGRWSLAAVEFAFFYWSKSFVPLQMAVIGLMVVLAAAAASKKGFACDEVSLPKAGAVQKFVLVFTAASLVLALPHLAKSLYYAGTPLYPLGAGMFPPAAHYTPDHWHAILQRAGDCVAEKDSYGHGRSLTALIKHFWLMAVPEQGVNNAFDYPVGLIFLLVLAPFGGHVFTSLKSRKLPVLSLIIIVWWLTWWFGSQQSRFLLVPLTLMIILTISYLPRISTVLMALFVMALGLEVISLYDAHRHDWGRPFSSLIRDKDRKLLALRPADRAEVVLDFPDVAFAPFAVNVHRNDSIYVMPQ